MKVISHHKITLLLNPPFIHTKYRQKLFSSTQNDKTLLGLENR